MFFFSRNYWREFFRSEGAAEFLPPTPSFRRTRAERAGIFLKMGSRYIQNIPQFKTFQLFRWGQVGMLAAPRGAARKELSQKIPRRKKRKGSGLNV